MSVNTLSDILEIGPGIDFIFTAGGGEGHENRRHMTTGFTAFKLGLN